MKKIVVLLFFFTFYCFFPGKEHCSGIDGKRITKIDEGIEI